ncbi:MAG: CHAT domain-containing tetratricopeptide repeat protein [Cyclobacteriaceae bacterium]
MRNLIFLLFLFITSLAVGQTCLQKLDSAEYFKYVNQQKAKFYASSALSDLDSARCVVEIGIAAAYNNLGLILWETNDKKRSLYAFHSGLTHELVSKDSTHQDLLGLYYNLSTLYEEIGSFDEAGKFLTLSGKVIDAAYQDDAGVKLRYEHRKGIYHREVGNFNESLEALQNAIAINDQLGDDSTRIALQIEIGTTYKHFGDFKQSEAELMKAVEQSKNRNELQYLTAIDRLSSLKIEQGEYSDSENYLLYNLDRKREKYASEPLLELETLNGLSVLYYKLNDLESANDYMNQALESTGDIRSIRPYMMNNLGTIYMKQGDIENAEKSFREAVDGFRELFGTMNPDYASSLNNLAGIYKAQGKLAVALNVYTKVLDMDKVIYGENNQRYATSLNNVALLYLQLGNTSLAGKLLQRAKEIRREALGDFHPLYIKTLNDLGIYYLISKDSISAMDEFNLALKAEIKHMADIFPVLTDNQRKLYFDQSRANIERFCSMAFKPKYINTQYAEDALNHFINTKGILFYASEKMRRIVQSSGDKQTIRIYDEWREKKYKLAQAYLLTESERRIQGISIEDLEGESTELEKQLAQKFKVFSDQESAEYHNWQEISNVLPDSTVTLDIIQFRNYTVSIKDEKIAQGFEDRSNYAAFIIGKDSLLQPVIWPKEADFEKGFAQYRNSLKFAVKDVASYKVFWEPIDRYMDNVKKVYLANDGIYHKLNPAVFFNAKKNLYVSDEYDIIYITSGKDLLYNVKKKLIKDAQIFGNPDFSQVVGYQLNQLPGAEREASDITEILDVRKWKSETFYFSNATEEQIKTLQNPGVIHLATHGYFDDDPNHADPLHSSGIFLSKQVGSANDGLLSAYEAMNLALDQTSLVVLAACETGLGTVQNGEGVFGLQRAFLVAGADNILLSLVKINDQAARNFMNLFYKALLEEEDAQRAFFNARAQFKKIDSNPYNWGAYILVSKS